MTQFDVFRNPSTTTRKHYLYLVDIQSPYLEELATRIVIPLGKASLFKNTAMKGLTPEVTFHDEKLLLLTPQISSIAKRQLKEPIGSLSHLRDELMNALDFAIFGI
ncbi:CcdB family protein [Sedimenticola hydrogenitrophicus]|uniref:CcdB family protein n=1 Tax=Sedimenticola hydrogenitrophicus TaxID=2967975 RepID=UPI0021A4FB5A|nr:CcdB family protein [Sedimenticola hydrogenitrophicus]